MTKQNVVTDVENKIKHFKSKADHNKNESLRSFKLIMLSSVLAPIFIAYGTGDIWGKIIPSLLSCLGAFLTAWLQLRKPNQLWTLYRTSQREIESELQLYSFEAGKYKDIEHKDEALIESVNEIYLKTNNGWSALVPNKEDINSIEANKES
ncbi:DUF4231 domain-containing protein [Vibrio cyclitrophicus]